MNAFEELVAACIAADGYWTTTAYKVELSPDDKAKIELPSSPRWELDIVAYNPVANIVRVVECKSYLDSVGVDTNDLTADGRYNNRYKLFTRKPLWPIISQRLLNQLQQEQRVLPGTQVRLGLAFGKAKDVEKLKILFKENNWDLFPPAWLRWQLERLAALGWQNSTTSLVTKLLLVHTKDSRGVVPENPYSSLSDQFAAAYYDRLRAGSVQSYGTPLSKVTSET